MTDIDSKESAEWKEPTIESLRQQLAERDVVIKDFAQIERGMEEQLAESQALVKVLKIALVFAEELLPCTYNMIKDALALPSDSTALDSAIRQAKREALLEAATNFDQYEYGSVWAHRLRRMADELDTNAGL